jgi:antitoxin component of MazEF toxin-antitoxin module
MVNIKFGTRKVGKKGDGLCLMLPSIWVKNADISAGERIVLEMRGNKLIVKPEVKQK